MKAYISYSLTDKEQYTITLLSYKLREKGFSLIMSAGNAVFQQNTEIVSSQLFIGVITTSGLEWRRVMDEYNYAVNAKIPAILLVEQGVRVDQAFKGNLILFNRNNPEHAIQEINNRMAMKPTKTNDEVSWLLGGAALLALIALFAGSSNRK